MNLRLLGPSPEWSDAVSVGVLTSTDGEVVDVWCRQVPSEAHALCESWSHRTPAGVLPVLRASLEQDHTLLLHPRLEAAAVKHLTPLPARATAELLAAVCATLAGLGADGPIYPGPGGADLLVQPDGTVYLVPRPEGGAASEQMVRRLRALADLLVKPRRLHPTIASAFKHIPEGRLRHTDLAELAATFAETSRSCPGSSLQAHARTHVWAVLARMGPAVAPVGIRGDQPTGDDCTDTVDIAIEDAPGTGSSPMPLPQAPAARTSAPSLALAESADSTKRRTTPPPESIPINRPTAMPPPPRHSVTEKRTWVGTWGVGVLLFLVAAVAASLFWP